MFSLGESHRYYLYSKAADMRKGFDGLSGLVRNELGLDPMSGDVYMFINQGRNRLKMLVWEEGGFVLYHKRLERGRFEYPRVVEGGKSAVITWQMLMFMVKGIDQKSVKFRKRYEKENRKKTG